MSNYQLCIILANIYLAANFVRLGSDPLFLLGFGMFWLGLGLISKFWG